MNKAVEGALVTDDDLFAFLRWNGYRSERHKLLYVATPKVACTSLKWWFAALEGYADKLYDIDDSAESDPDLVVHESHKVAPHVTGLDKDELQRPLNSDEFFRFAVVRNPYQRIFSAWQSKLVLQEPLQIGRYLNFEFLRWPMRSAADIAPAFEAFLEHLASHEAPTFWDHHWATQFSLLRPDLVNYAQVAQLEHTASLSRALRDRLGDDVPNPFGVHRANESLIPYQQEFFTARSAELVRQLYAADFDAFGYDRELPATKDTFSEAQAAIALKGIHLLRARHAQLGRRAGQMARFEREAHERDAAIAGLNQIVAERDAAIVGLNRIVVERDAAIAGLDQIVVERDAAIAGLDQIVVERDAAITGLDQIVAERSAAITGLTQVVVERDAAIARLNQAAAERDAAVAGLNQAMVERDEQIDLLRRTTIGFNGRVDELDRLVVESDAQLSQLDCRFRESSAQLAELRETNNTHVVHLEHAIQERDLRIERLHREVAARTKQVDAESRRLNEIFTSRTWRLAARLQRGAVACRRVFGAGRMPLTARVRQSLRVISDVRLVRASGLFDSEFYLEHNPDVRAAGVDPIRHFLVHGWREARDPSSSFSTSRYLSRYPDIAQAQVEPLTHYIRHGRAEGRLASAGMPALPVQEASPLVSEPPPVEDEAALAWQQAEAQRREARIDEEVTVIEQSGMFETAYYLWLNPELALRPEQAIRHYCEYGWQAYRNPSSEFDTRHYLETYADIRNAGINPLWHYVIAGAKECRHAVAASDNLYEEEIFLGMTKPEVQLIAFYKSVDWAAVRGGRPRFKGHAQPILPSEREVGFYDPLDGEVLARQVKTARRHGIGAFCFDLRASADGVRREPVERLLELPDADIGFCVNLDPTSPDQTEALLKRLTPMVADRRYLRCGARPVIVVTAGADVTLTAEFVGRLRQRLVLQGLGTPYLIGRDQTVGEDAALAPEWGFDATFDLPIAADYSDSLSKYSNGAVIVPYGVVATHRIERLSQASTSAQERTRIPVVAFARDNSATRAEGATVHTRFDLKDYRRWLDAAIAHSCRSRAGDRRLVFIDAWNDWNEGRALEPDRRTGFSRLNETSRALAGVRAGLAMPKVSVVVTNYNHEPFLRRRLDSIYGQTYKNIEVILLDDCSSDQSRLVLDEYAAAYPDMTRKLYNEANSGGVFRQWARGIEMATGKLVWIAESDDYCDEHFLERLVSTFEDEAVLLAYGFSCFVDRNETPLEDGFHSCVSDLDHAEKWRGNYVETAHNEVRAALGIKNTIPNASSVVFRRPVDLPLLKDESWLSMRVAGDWVLYLHLLRGGKIAYRSDAVNFFRRYPGSTADSTYKKEVFYREVGQASRTVAELYDVPLEVLERCRRGYEDFYWNMVGRESEEFLRWYDYLSVLQARQRRTPSVMVTTMGFSPGGAEILPIRMANELKRQGHAVLLLSTGLMVWESRIRNLVRNDVPVVEMSDIEQTRELIKAFGIEALNSHQWHVQQYPTQVPDVFDALRVHVASLHGMIEHEAFGVTDAQLLQADEKVSTWVYTAEKNLVPFREHGLYDETSMRFTKIPNGMMPAKAVPVPRSHLNIPDDAFVLCCVSRAIPEKGWAETIAAVAQARELSNRDIRLVLVGNGAVYDAYCQTGVEDFVHLVGFSENSVGHYALADMGIMLTRFKSESFPLTIIDCLFAGKPYIATDVGDIRNMLTEGTQVAGAIVELEDWEVPVGTAALVIASFAASQREYHEACALVEGVANRYKIDMATARYVELFAAARNSRRIGAQQRLQRAAALDV